MFVVGLTGGIGAGKSLVANLFATRGIPIIDTDLIARELTEPTKPALSKIVKHFSPTILEPNGTLNRRKLRKIIFEHPNERAWLEALLHPLIKKEMVQALRALDAPYAIVVIPLLFEVEFYTDINRILLVDTPEALQIERVMTRDKADKVDIIAIIKNQADRQSRLARAHDIISNDRSIIDLEEQVETLHQAYLKLSQAKP